MEDIRGNMGDDMRSRRKTWGKSGEDNEKHKKTMRSRRKPGST